MAFIQLTNRQNRTLAVNAQCIQAFWPVADTDGNEITRIDFAGDDAELYVREAYEIVLHKIQGESLGR